MIKNEDKIKELLNCNDCCMSCEYKCPSYNALIKMAEWKDNKINEQDETIRILRREIDRLEKANRNLTKELRNQSKKIKSLKDETKIREINSRISELTDFIKKSITEGNKLLK